VYGGVPGVYIGCIYRKVPGYHTRGVYTREGYPTIPRVYTLPYPGCVYPTMPRVYTLPYPGCVYLTIPRVCIPNCVHTSGCAYPAVYIPQGVPRVSLPWVYLGYPYHGCTSGCCTSGCTSGCCTSGCTSVGVILRSLGGMRPFCSRSLGGMRPFCSLSSTVCDTFLPVFPPFVTPFCRFKPVFPMVGRTSPCSGV